MRSFALICLVLAVGIVGTLGAGGYYGGGDYGNGYGNSGYGSGYGNSGYGNGYGNSGYGGIYGNIGYGNGYGNSGYGGGYGGYIKGYGGYGKGQRQLNSYYTPSQNIPSPDPPPIYFDAPLGEDQMGRDFVYIIVGGLVLLYAYLTNRT